MPDSQAGPTLELRRLTLAALFLALGLVLPFFTGQIPQIGSMLLPMHLPILLCGFVCGWRWGLGLGLLAPLLRSLLLGMPPLYPQALAMAGELATYGALTGWLMGAHPWRDWGRLYRSLLGAMLAGRLAWGTLMVFLLGLGPHGFGWSAFLAGALFNSLPGIILQLAIIPPLLVSLERAGWNRLPRAESEAA